MHGDVFRPPTAIMLLSLSVGSGTQLLVMILVALVFACLGFLSPPNRGALMTAVLVSVISLLLLGIKSMWYTGFHTGFYFFVMGWGRNPRTPSSE